MFLHLLSAIFALLSGISRDIQDILKLPAPALLKLNQWVLDHSHVDVFHLLLKWVCSPNDSQIVEPLVNADMWPQKLKANLIQNFPCIFYAESTWECF